MMNDDDVVVARASGRETVEELRRSSKRSTAPTNTAILTIGIRGAHKPHDNRLPNQESPPNREPGSTARGAADVSQPGPLDAANDDGVRLAVQRTTRPQQTRSHATTRGAINGGTHRQAPRRQQLTSPTRQPTTPKGEPPGTTAYGGCCGINSEADQQASN